MTEPQTQPSQTPSAGSNQPQYGQYARPEGQHMPLPVDPGQEPHPRNTDHRRKWTTKTITLKIWQFLLSMVGAVFAGMVLLILLAFAISPAENGTTGSNASKPVTNSQQAAPKKSTTPKTKELTSISVTYSGPTTAGTEINDTSEGIDVTAFYSDGSSLEGITAFTVKNPGVLQAGQNQDFTVEYHGKEDTFTVAVEETDDQFKAAAQDIPYDDLARNPDANTGKKVHFRGKIIQVIEDGNSVQYRISVQQGSYGIWDSDKVVYVLYNRTGNDNRLLENDIVEFWGTSTGTITYQSTLGGNITIPSVMAKIMQLAQ